MGRARFTALPPVSQHTLIGALPGPDLAAAGYTVDEYSVAGTAAGCTPDGPVDPADFATRILVRRPAEAAAFNGTVVLEWLNVSSGTDAAPEYTYLADELVRSGYAWAGVSAQYAGVHGGGGSLDVGLEAHGLVGAKPDRYGSLHHPGDAYCYDLFGAVGAALADPSDDPGHPLAGLSVTQILAVGESQSAMAMTTYVNRFAAGHGVFDGYLIHSRARSELPLGPVGGPADLTGAYTGPATPIDDIGRPVFVLQTETDVVTDFRYYTARQPDTARLRVWEMAGTSHADFAQIGPFEDFLNCPAPVNRGQQRFVLRAALHHLTGWAAGGPPPPHATPLALDDPAGTDPALLTDDFGNARGGVRTPYVDVPTATLSGVTLDPVSRICMLFGVTLPIPAERLRARYGSVPNYLAEYSAAVDAVIAGGFALEADRAQLLADAHPQLLD